MQFSDDDGKTWSKARNIGDQIDDPAWGWYATGPVHGIQLTRGAHAGRLVAGTNYDNGAGVNAGQLVYSDDHGETWHKGATDLRSDATPQEISVVEKVDGGVYAGARNNAGGVRRQPDVRGQQRRRADVRAAVRHDRGSDHAVGAGFVATVECRRPGRQVQPDPVRRAGRSRSPRYMTIRSSFDEGKTWQTVADGTRITSDWSGVLRLAILDTGEIGLLYEGGTVDARDQIRFARFTENDIGHPDAPLGATTPDISGLRQRQLPSWWDHRDQREVRPGS